MIERENFDMKYDLLLKGGQVFTEGRLQEADIYVKDGVIAQIGKDLEKADAEKVLTVDGDYVRPGFIDPHVHLNDPGLTNSEDFYTGTCAAAAGGVTTVLEHPLTAPLPATEDAFVSKRKIGESKVVVDFALFGACAPDNERSMKKIIDSGAAAFKTFLPYSSEIPMLSDNQVLDKMRFLSDKDIVLAIHCENNDIVEKSTARMQELGKTKFSDYPDGRPAIAEIEAVSRMCLFAKVTGCKINIAHCSLAEAVDVVEQNKREGVNVSVETCPQYLLFDRSTLDSWREFSICNPPVREAEDVENLWNRLFDGKIDWVCSDHSTYTIEEKMAGGGNPFGTPAGIAGIQHTYQLLFSEGVVKRGLPLEKFVELSSSNAAKRYRLYPQKGLIAVGADADFAILNPDKEWIIRKEDLKQMIKWTPYDGMTLRGKVEKTIANGREVYDGEDVLARPGSGRYLTPLPE